MYRGSQHCTAGSDRNHPQEKEMQNGCLRRAYKQLRKEVKGKGEKERHTHLNAEFQRTARRDKKAFLNARCKDKRKTIEWERLEISSKMRDTKGTFHAKMGTIKDRNGMDLTEAEDIKKNTQNIYTKKILMTWITMMV